MVGGVDVSDMKGRERTVGAVSCSKSPILFENKSVQCRPVGTLEGNAMVEASMRNSHAWPSVAVASDRRSDVTRTLFPDKRRNHAAIR